jgi:hypothetical protein
MPNPLLRNRVGRPFAITVDSAGGDRCQGDREGVVHTPQLLILGRHTAISARRSGR